VTNIPGSQVDKGTVLAPYMGPAPPPGTGHHRYVFVVFKQKDQIPHETMHKCVCTLWLADAASATDPGFGHTCTVQ
jgi:phosphatidylethanolamine-binding protein (PEBP) family uncharacterized protein